MSEFQPPPYDYDNESGSGIDRLQRLVWAAKSEISEEATPDVIAPIRDQLWSDDPDEVAEALLETGDFLKYKSQYETFETAYGVVNENLDRLMEIAACGDASLEVLAMQTIYEAWMGSEQDDPHIIAAFKSCLPRLIAAYPSSSKDKAEDSPLQPLAQEFVDDLMRPPASNQMNTMLQFLSSDFQLPGISRQERRTMKLKDNNILDAFGYTKSTAKLIEDWEDGMKPTRRKRGAARAMQVMAELEVAEPGTVATLREANGIRNFQRYDPRMLHEMHRDQIEHPDKDYVLMIQSVRDHNNAFRRPDTYAGLYARLKKIGYGLRIYECGDLEEIDKVTEKILRNYADHDAKIVSELILGHGSPDGVMLGANRYPPALTRLSAHYLDQTIHGNIARAMTQDAWIRFMSCSTGKEMAGRLCISKEVAITMGKTAIAPTADVGFTTMRPIRSGNGVNVQVEYRRKKGRRSGKAHYVPSKPAIFNGKTERSQRGSPIEDYSDGEEVFEERLDDLLLSSPVVKIINITDEHPTDKALVHIEPMPSSIIEV